MRRYQIIPLILVGVLSAGGASVIGYAFGRSGQDSLAETNRLAEEPIRYLAAAGSGYSSSPSALRDSRLPSEPAPKYILGTDHGFVAVFHAADGGLKELTRTPEAALSPEERELLTNGVFLYTEEQLIRALQDYGS